MRRLLLVFRHAPYSTAFAQEGLDAVMAASALEFEISVLFIDDGVFLLNQGQNLLNTGLRDYPKGFKALNDFGVERICADSNSLAARGLQENELTISVETIDADGVTQLLRDHQQVLTF